MEVLAFRSAETTCSSTTMLFHGLPGGEMQGVIDEMDRRGKGDSAAISSAIDMGETEAVRFSWSGVDSRSHDKRSLVLVKMTFIYLWVCVTLGYLTVIYSFPHLSLNHTLYNKISSTESLCLRLC